MLKKGHGNMTTTQDTHNTMTQLKHMTTHDTTHDAYAHTCNEGVFTFEGIDTIAAQQHDRCLLIQPPDSADDRPELSQRMIVMG